MKTTLTCQPLAGCLGARIEGVDICSADADLVAQLRDALYEHLVIFLPGQQVATDDDQLAFAQLWGDVDIYPIARMFGATVPTIETIEDDAEKKPAAGDWHTDVTWIDRPPEIGMLRADVIPDRGGHTLWSSQYAAFEALSPSVQQFVGQLDAFHDVEQRFLDAVKARAGKDVAAQLREEFPGAVHPIVITHPQTGRKALYVNRGFTRRIVGLSEIESESLLSMLFRHTERPDFQVRYRWTVGDFAIWDERATHHYATADHYPAHRRMQRCTIAATSVPSR